MSEQIVNLHSFDFDPKTRFIYINGEINEDTYLTFAKNINYLNHLSVEPIIIFLSSIGGDSYYGLGIYDLIKSSIAPTAIIGVGLIASAASFIIQAANIRLMTPSTNMFIHSLYVEGDIERTVKEMRDEAAALEKLWEQILEIYAEKMRKDELYVRNWIDREKDIYLLPQEATKLKLCDGIYGSRKYKTIDNIKSKLVS